MDLALVVGIYVLGAASGGVVVLAWVYDRKPRTIDVHSYSDDVEQRARRVQ
jgi:hypothetical protein